MSNALRPRILIVDDVIENVTVLGNALSGSYDIQFAQSGRECLSQISLNKPDLILLDVMMPGMSGYEVFSVLKSDEDTADIPIIFVTAKNDAASESEALHAGAADFIHKPINIDVVRARTRQQLELAQHRKYLEKLVLRRTEEMAIARSEAESANAVKTRLMANVSHEMRTPLQGILGFAEIGLHNAGNASPEKLDQYFSMIRSSGQRLLTLVESLLVLVEQAHAEHANVSGNDLQEVRIDRFIDEIALLMSLRAGTRQQQLHLDMQSRAACFTADPVRLRQVMEHLLANALAYSPAGATVTLRVRDREIPPAPGRKPALAALSFQVIDEGCGIPASELNAVFEPFYQSSRTATGAGGTGLGLPLSQCIVARHGGTLTLENRPEGGLIAEVLIPLARTGA